MISAFNTVYSALQGFFSRGFWFAAFLPVAIFATAHALIARQVYGADKVHIFGFKPDFTATAAEGAVSGAVIVVGLVVVAYAILPLLPLLRGLLDGSLLPPTIHDSLRDARMAETRELEAKKLAAMKEWVVLDDMWADAHQDDGALKTKYRAAAGLTSAADEQALQTATKSLHQFSKAFTSSASLQTAAADAQRDVLALLTVNNPSSKHLKAKRHPDNKVPPKELEIAVATDEAASDFEGLLGQAWRDAEYRVKILKARNRVDAALDAPRATRVGEARFIAERHSYDVYQVDFEFLWPRLLVALRAEKSDDPMLETIETARSNVDFAILSLVLAITVPLVWLPLLLIEKGEPWMFLGIGVATPAVLGFCYQLVFEGQLALADVIKTAIDRSRFLVLKMLRQPEPASLSEERELWTRMANAAERSRTTDLLYVRRGAEQTTQ
jgi:hypothetical protein